MHVIKRKEGTVTMIRPTGPMVCDEMDDLDTILTELIKQWERRVLINMEDVTFIDSAGLELLLSFQDKLRDYGAKLKLSHLNEINQKILEITRLESQFDVYPDALLAMKSFL